MRQILIFSTILGNYQRGKRDVEVAVDSNSRHRIRKRDIIGGKINLNMGMAKFTVVDPRDLPSDFYQAPQEVENKSVCFSSVTFILSASSLLLVLFTSLLITAYFCYRQNRYNVGFK